MKNVVVVLNEGGNIEEVLTDKETMQVVIVDQNIEGLDDDQIVKVEGEEAYIYEGIKEAKVVPDRVNKIFEDSSRKLAEIDPDKLMVEMIKIKLENYLDLQGVNLSEEQKEEAMNGIKFSLQITLEEALSDSVQSVIK